MSFDYRAYLKNNPLLEELPKDQWVDLDKKSRAACFLTKFCFRGAVPHQSMFYKTEIQGVKFPEDMVYLCCSKR